ncbi:UDP-glucuronosyltransferase 2B20 [Acyrthosiphon pisum]|uniref:UDP-glucuronosyltransferase n=1 Tax=Acyrthosiphon pisum TaxID=7029 RepID=A0A8R2JSC4_ACYPI|nr:UDP-glucuronosyltransferase 2B20 [Acyrthosiphon pisum]XP_029346012.1 UDP-glucuronosyltransferase 2B20 [Acyrthosiphon pisum]XP_029346013.1 UDP-glucuronosyltransferase 2B20 [Acyrthosiphon pisum]XP_029346014.1 UDP-glucuronosyltransferase 2B20 [Acyrthosiphon pisum]|eukprot:XP_016660305.1 PREDICTED: UDP-glucuronosyltransferase 2B20 [Acyrthosiphon pisum]
MSSFPAAVIALCTSSALLQWTPVGAANILAIQSIAAKSHWNVMQAVLRTLTDRGHTVTAFTPFADGDRGGYTEVDISGDLESKVGLNVSRYTRSTRQMFTYMVNALRVNCGTIFEHPRMQDILEGRSPPFDAVIAEAHWSDCVSYAATVLRVPAIYVVPSPIVTHAERSFFGHVPNPAAVSNLLSPRGVPKTFGERFANTLRTVYGSWLVWDNERRLRQSDRRPFDAMDLVRPSLTFTNTHFITEPSRPLTPDVVQIGGIHLTPPGTIPKDILEFIDNAPNGVIYLTFGSVVLMTSLPENILRALKEAIARVPQKVLWKYEGEMVDKPKNVMTRKWFPQRDILLHPNVKLFISHGGISGVYEAVDAGVPLLGFPINYDQPRNIDNLVDAGMAISLDLFSVTTDTVFNAIMEIADNDRYRQNANIASDRFKDRPMSPAESVVYWTENVLRHNGAPHLKSHALNLTWYQYFIVDIISTFFSVGSVLFFIIYCGLKMICKHVYTFFHSVKEKRE